MVESATSCKDAGKGGENCKPFHIVLGRETMHFRALKLCPEVVVAVTHEFSAAMDAIGDERKILL
jgi:hypothetical protein